MNEYMYYKPEVKKEHLLFAKELAELAGIMTEKGKPHTLFISVALSNSPELFYCTKHGMRRVYENADVYRLLDLLVYEITKTVEKNAAYKDGEEVALTVSFDERKFKLIIDPMKLIEALVMFQE